MGLSLPFPLPFTLLTDVPCIMLYSIYDIKHHFHVLNCDNLGEELKQYVQDAPTNGWIPVRHECVRETFSVIRHLQCNGYRKELSLVDMLRGALVPDNDTGHLVCVRACTLNYIPAVCSV